MGGLFSSFHACFTFSLTFLSWVVADVDESSGLENRGQTIAKMQMRSDINLHAQVPHHLQLRTVNSRL